MLCGLRRCFRLRGLAADTSRLRLCRHASTAAARHPRYIGSEALPSRTRPASHEKPTTWDRMPSPQRSNTASTESSYKGLSPRVIRAFQSVGVHPPSWMLRLPVLPAERIKYGITLRACRQHTWHPYHAKHLGPEGSPLQGKYIWETLRRTEEPLWIYNRPLRDQQYRGVVIHQSTAKINKALRLALKAAGYDAVGRRLSDSAASPQRKHSAGIEELFGSLRLDFFPQRVMQIPLKEIVNHLRRIIQTLEPKLGRKRDRGPSHRRRPYSSR